MDHAEDMTAGERTRERILAEALPLFARLGFDGTSVRLVASAAAVNVATLAYHFGDKAGLYRTLVTRLYEELGAVQVDLQGSDDPVGSAVRQLWRFARAHALHIRLLHRHVLDRGEHTDVATGPLTEPLLARADGLLGLVRPGSTVQERRFLLFSVLHLIVRFVLEPADTLRQHYLLGPEPDAVVEDWLVEVVHRLLETRRSSVPNV